jgi:hypothetical protein
LPLKYFWGIFPLKEEKGLVKSVWDWHCWNSNIIDFTGENEAICETALGRESGP